MAQKTFVFPGFESSVDYTAINDEGMSEPFRKESITLAELNKELEEELFESSDGSQGTCCVPLLDHRRQLVRFLGFTASSHYNGVPLSQSLVPRMTRLFPWALFTVLSWIAVIVLFLLKMNSYAYMVLPLATINMIFSLITVVWSVSVTRAARDFRHVPEDERV